MIQKTIRDWGGVEFTTTEGAEQQTEWNDRTEHEEDGFNSIAELGTNQKHMKVKTDLITIADAIDLDNEKAATALNTAKLTYPSADSTKLAGIETGATADQSDVEIKTAYENNADTNAFTDAEQTKVGNLTVTSAIDLDSNVPLLNANNTFTGWIDMNNNDIGNVSRLLIGETGSFPGQLIIYNSAGTESLLLEGDADEFQFKSDLNIGIQKTITNIDSASDSSLITKEWAEQQYGAIADVATNNNKTGVTTEEANTIDSVTSGEPTGADQVLNVVSLTQAEYDAGTPVATTFYIITDA